MLVLSRQRDETIMIGDDIEITVVDIRGDKVRLGITAPTSIAVHRKEVYEAIKAENEQASRIGDKDLDLLSRGAPNEQERRSASVAARLSGHVRDENEKRSSGSDEKPKSNREKRSA